MIRYYCPRCHMGLQSGPETAGSKMACPSCGQRLQVPQPPPQPPINKTVLASTEPPPPPQPPPPMPSMLVVELLSPPPQPPPAPAPALPPAPLVVPTYEPDPEPELSPRFRSFRRTHTFSCPYCGTDELPWQRSEISGAGWAVFVILLLFCFPLFWIGFFIKDTYRICARCGIRLG
ncbi:MAG: LITAF-like zinc ribbon domain-containing protein [Gemmataceae bacterium]|nr:LITAF-like zinc ribbon domain-containing protein [Gemmataceae bacterium]